LRFRCFSSFSFLKHFLKNITWLKKSIVEIFFVLISSLWNKSFYYSKLFLGWYH
jgi:hypothetical protein